MYRIGDKYILTEIQGFEDGYIDDNPYYGGRVFEASIELNYTEQYIKIPKYIFVLTHNSIDVYTFVDIGEIYDDIGTTYTFMLSENASHILNSDGVSQYNIYNMMYKDGDKDDNWIDIKEFDKKYTEQDIV